MRYRRRKLPPVVLVVIVPIQYAIGAIEFLATRILHAVFWFFTGYELRIYSCTSDGARHCWKFLWFPLPAQSGDRLAWLEWAVVREEIRYCCSEHEPRWESICVIHPEV